MSQDLIIAGESGVEAYIDALTRVGRREVAGRFTLDEAKARAKLSRYQLVTPHHYVLEFVQAAQLLGATYITARAGGGWFELRFDGVALTAPELGQLWGAAFAAHHDDRERAMRHMAIGVQAALGLNPRQVNIICDSGHERVIFSVEGESAAVVRVEPGQRAGTLVQVRKAINLGVLHQSATAIEGRLPEFMLLRYRCALSEIPVLVNGQRVSVGWRPRDAHDDDGCFVRVPIETEWERGWLGIRSPQWPSLVSVMQHGVLVTDHKMPAGPVSVRAVVESRRLSKNLSQSAFVQDEAWHTFMDEVILEAWHEALLRYLEPLLMKEDEAPALGLGAIGRLVLSHVAQLRERGHQIKGATRQLALVIEQLALWRAGDRVGEEAPSWRPCYVSLAQLGVGLMRARPLAVTRVMFQEVAYEDDCHAMLVVGPDVSLIEAYLGQAAVEVTERLELKALRQRNERTWRGQPLFHGALDEAVYPCQLTQPLEQGGFVMVAFVARGLSTSALQVYKQGRLLFTRQLSQAPVPRLLIIWSADPEPNARFDGIDDDGDYVEAMLSAVAMVPELIERYLSRESYPDERVWRALLDGLCDATWWRALLKALGVVEVPAVRLDAWRAQLRAQDACGWALSEHVLARERGAVASRPALELLATCSWLARRPYLEQLGDSSQRSLMQVFEQHARLGFIPWVSREHESHAQRLWRVVRDDVNLPQVLVLDEQQRQRLANIAPRGALRAYEAELERMVHRQRFMRLRPRQLELMHQDGEFIARRRLHDGLRGELGLCDVILDEGGLWASGGWLEVIVLVSGRLLARRRFRVGFGCFVAVIEAEALSPTLGWDDLIEDEAWREVELSLCEAARALIVTRLIAVTREGGGAPARQLELLWSFIVASQAHRARLWAHDELLGERLARAKLFSVTGQAEALSYVQVQAQLESQDQLGFVQRRDVQRVDEGGWLIVPDELEAAQPLLAQLFWHKRRIYSWGQRVEDHAQLVQARQAYMTRPPFEWRPIGALCTIEEGPDERGRRFSVALFVEEDPRRVGLELSLVCEGREAARRQLRRRWWRVEVMISSLSLIDWELSSALDGEQVRELIARAQSLESRVIARWVEALDEPERSQEDGVEQRWRALWRARFTSVARMEESRQDEALLGGAWFKTNHGWLSLAELEALHAKSMVCFAWPEDEDEVMSALIDAHVVILPTRASLRELTALFDGRAWVSWSERGEGAGEPSSIHGELEAGGEVLDAEASRAAHSRVFLDELAALMNRLCVTASAKDDSPLVVRSIDWAPLPERALVVAADGHLSLNSSHEGLQVLSQMMMFEERGDADWAWCWLLCSVIYTACFMRAEDDGAARALEFQARLVDHVLAWERD